MEKAFLEDIPNEVTASSAILTVLGAVQFVPKEIIKGLPGSSFLSGFFANMIDFVLMYSSQMPFHSYTLGLVLLAGATAPFVYQDKASVFSFLTQTVLALYGFLGLLVIMNNPYLISDAAIIGLGAQILLTGFAATQIFKNVLRSEDFGFQVDKTVYAVAVWQYLTGAVVLSTFQYVYQFRAVPMYAVIFAVLGLYGLALIYASLEIAVNSMTGLLISASFISLLLLSSLVTFSLGGVLSAVFVAGLIYWKRDLFERRHSLSTLRDFKF